MASFPRARMLRRTNRKARCPLPGPFHSRCEVTHEKRDNWLGRSAENREWRRSEFAAAVQALTDLYEQAPKG